MQVARESIHHSPRTRKIYTTSTVRPTATVRPPGSQPTASTSTARQLSNTQPQSSDEDGMEDQDPIVQGIKATLGFFVLCLAGSIALVALLLVAGRTQTHTGRWRGSYSICLTSCAATSKLPGFNLFEVPLRSAWSVKVYLSAAWATKDGREIKLWEDMAESFDMVEALERLGVATSDADIIDTDVYAITPINTKVIFALLVTSLSLMGTLLGLSIIICRVGFHAPPWVVRRSRGMSGSHPKYLGEKAVLGLLGLAMVFSLSATAFSLATVSKAIRELKRMGASPTAKFGAGGQGLLGGVVGMQLAAVLFFGWFLWFRRKLLIRDAVGEREEEATRPGTNVAPNDIELHSITIAEPPPPYTPPPYTATPGTTESTSHRRF